MKNGPEGTGPHSVDRQKEDRFLGQGAGLVLSPLQETPSSAVPSTSTTVRSELVWLHPTPGSRSPRTVHELPLSVLRNSREG